MEDRPARSKAPAKETEQKAYPALYILLSAPEAVLEQAVQDSPDAEGRLNDVRREFVDCGWRSCERWCARTRLTIHLEGFALDREHAGLERELLAFDIYRRRTITGVG
jgi:hypothetical protein